MGVEVMSSKPAETVEGNSAMKFGSVGETPVNGEVNNVSANGELNKAPEGNVPNNVREEWPEPTQIHSFYAVKYRPFEDDKLKGLLDQADKELQKIYKARSACLEKLRPLRSERQQLMSVIIPLNNERKQFRAAIDEKRKEMEPLQKNLGQLRNTMGGGGNRERGGGGGGREKGSGLCSSEAELNAYIKSLQYRIQHESITLNEEKQILRDIKQLESTREKVIANAVTRAKIEESVGDKEALQEQVKLIGVGLDGVRKEQDALMIKIKKLEGEKAVIDDKIKLIEEELNELDAKKSKANENLDGLKAKLRDVNAPFYQNNNLLKSFKDVAAKKDIESLKQRTATEVENFVSQWASKKAFREDYEKRILISLDMRQLSKDGRMRNPEEKPLVQVVRPNTVVPTQKSEAVVKQPKEEVVSTQKKDAALPTEKVSKEKEKVSKVPKEATNKKKDGLVGQSDPAVAKGDDFDFEIPKKVAPKVEKVDKEKLKEIKREEEIAKNKQAMERKKKLAEKAAAKAALKAQKEAEEKQKKQKEREKKARKKGGATELQEESNEADGVDQEVADEEENAEEKIEQAAPSQKKERKENGIRSRPRPRSTTGSLPKAILKRKKATNYWPYAGTAAAVVVLLLLAVGYSYFA